MKAECSAHGSFGVVHDHRNDLQGRDPTRPRPAAWCAICRQPARGPHDPQRLGVGLTCPVRFQAEVGFCARLLLSG